MCIEYNNHHHSSFGEFGDGDVVGMRTVRSDDAIVHVCDLWHGPTLAFKDLGLQVCMSAFCVHALLPHDMHMHMHVFKYYLVYAFVLTCMK